MSGYEVRLVGEHASLGEVPAVDVGKLLIHVQSIVARAAGVALGRAVKSTGRWGRVIEDATRLRLVKLSRGSVIAHFDMPTASSSDPELALSVQTLGDRGWQIAMTALSDTERADYGIVLRLSQLAEDLAVGDRYSAVEFGPAGAGPKARSRIDGETRERLRSRVREQRERPSPPSSVAGVLVEADFEKRTAHVRTPTQALVELTFDDDLADDVYEALRERSEFEGDVNYDPITNAVRTVRLRRLTRIEQLLLGDDAGAFWRDRSAGDLIAEQGKDPVVTFDGIRDETMSDEEFASFFATLE